MQRGHLATALTALALAASAVAACTPAPSQPPVGTASPAVRPSTTPSPPVVAVTPQPIPTAAPSWTWTQLDAAQLRGLTEVVSLPDGRLLAVGQDQVQPILWTSEDAVTWTRLPEGASLRPRAVDCWVTVRDVEVLALGLVAVGDEECWDEPGQARAWTSIDGLAWQPASVRGATDRSMAEVVRTPRGLVALGDPWVLSRGPGDRREGGTVEWTSVDGNVWRRVPEAKAPKPGVVIRRVVAFRGTYYGLMNASDILTRRGRFVVDPRVGVWTSRDAVRWRQVAGSPPAADLQPLGGLLVAVGPQPASPSRRALVWTSADGAAWSEAALPPPVLPPGGVGAEQDPASVGMHAEDLLVVRDAGLLALGWRDDGSGDGDTVAWASMDGLSWSAVALPVWHLFLLDSACAAGSTVLLQGSYQDDPEADATVTALLGIPPRP